MWPSQVNVGHSKRATLVIFIVNYYHVGFEEMLDKKERKKIKRGDADWYRQSSLPDSFRHSHIVLRQCASARAAAMLMSYVSSWPYLTLSSGTIHIPAALSLPPYQRCKKSVITNQKSGTSTPPMKGRQLMIGRKITLTVLRTDTF